MTDAIFNKLESDLASNDKNLITTAMLYMAHNLADFDWTQEKLIHLLEENDQDIRGLALTCLGHVARISGRINEKLVFPVLREMLNDEILGGRAQDAIDDIEMFVK
ncbi:hypothetical protein [Acidovorax sp. SUPP2539]|uniref:hypothetical protein n=1 Tax=Acidovorax sp. SUPP2539 TaxID=2920878 RepID=UPI0023DE3CFC|nr:hypothetical protein [Acidovorax sp. SUPP2539]GKS88663.1 hypothetical protein AVTE2539_04880 [Acidovorax sp. SUPP2539]